MPLHLKELYNLLLELSPDVSSPQDKLGDAVSMFVSTRLLKTRIKYADITSLSDLLFEELQRQFEQALSGAGFSPFMEASGVGFAVEDFLLLVRCCLIVLQFLEFDLSLVLEKCGILMSVLRRLRGPELESHLSSCEVESPDKWITSFHSPASRECTALALTTGTTQACAPRASFFSAVLEVFIDELLMHHHLGKHFTMTDNVSATDKLFASHGSISDVCVIQELVSSHFLLSVHKEWTFDRFICSLFWSSEVDDETPRLGLNAALTLLGNCSKLSVPLMLQAHVIQLASRCIGIRQSENRRSDEDLMNCYILAFELSVNLYIGYISALDFADDLIGSENQSFCCIKDLYFDSGIQTVTFNKLSHQIDTLIDFCGSHSDVVYTGTKSDVLGDSFAYMKENQLLVNEACRDEMYLILNCIISSILPGETVNNTSRRNGDKVQQEIFCLAAALKLMSSSLLQIVWTLKQNGCLRGMKKLKDYGHCKEYNFVSGIISRIGKLGANPLVQKMLVHAMGAHPVRQKESVLMLAHFASLLSYSFRRRVRFLWNGCIFMMITVVNLLLFEEGSLEMFRSLLDMKEGAFCQNTLEKAPKDLVLRNSSAIIASNFQNIRMLYNKNNAISLAQRDQRMDLVAMSSVEREDGQLVLSSSSITSKDAQNHYPFKNEADTCNGEAFIKCLPSYLKKSSDWDDLVDFIECKHGKDYSDWLKKRERFRDWQQRTRCAKKKIGKSIGGFSKSFRNTRILRTS